MRLDEAKDLIEAKYDVVEVIDILGLETRDILNKFEDTLVECMSDFSDIHEAFEYDD